MMVSIREEKRASEMTQQLICLPHTCEPGVQITHMLGGHVAPQQLQPREEETRHFWTRLAGQAATPLSFSSETLPHWTS